LSIKSQFKADEKFIIKKMSNEIFDTFFDKRLIEKH